MSRHFKTLIVLLIFAPIVIADGLPGLTVRLHGVTLGGVPMTMLLLVLWFLIFVLVAWSFSRSDEGAEGDRP